MPLTTTLAFGPLLRTLRKQAGMTQRDLAAALGYSESLICNLEKAQRQPDLQVVSARFISALGLQDDPQSAACLIEQAALARGERSPASITFQRTVQLSVQEERTEFGAALPSPPTELIGRAAEINQLCNRLLGHARRLLTLLGPPGIGKTTLALAVAAHLQPHYPDRVVFVPLAAVSDPTMMASTILTAVGSTDIHPPKDKLIAYLRRKTMLLVLDNLEQIKDAAPLIAELVAECPGIFILATSRERLHLRAEQRYKVPPLDLAPAVELFVQRAQAVNDDFALTAHNQPTLEAICQRLDCLPLAIELCAAQIDLLVPTQLLGRLQDHRLDLLVDGARDLPARQRTLRSAIGYSHALLNEGERLLFRSLGVFAGGFALDAVAALAADRLESVTVQDTLHALIGKSLVRAETLPNGDQRFLLLETIREFALAQMGSDERRATQQRHTTYFMAQAVTNLDVLARDYANFRAALVWAIAAHDAQAALTLCISLGWFWEAHGYLHEGMTLARAALAISDAVDLDLRIDALASVSTMAFQGHQFDVALQFAEEAVTLARSNDQPGKLAFALNLLGWVFSEQGDYGYAEAALQESTQLARQAPHLYNLGCPLTELGEVAMARGDWAAAQTHLAQAIPFLVSGYQSLTVGVHVAMAHTNLAEVALAYGNPNQARHELRQALPQARWHIRRLRYLLLTLAGILLHTTQTQEVAAAAELLGAVAGLGDRSGGLLSPLYQALIAQRSESAQRLLIQHEWQTAWQLGHTWTLTQAVAEAEKWLAMSTEADG